MKSLLKYMQKFGKGGQALLESGDKLVPFGKKTLNKKRVGAALLAGGAAAGAGAYALDDDEDDEDEKAKKKKKKRAYMDEE